MGRQSTRTATGYAVGYGKPPIGTRFQKGRSGNPGGRRKSENRYEKTNQLILEEAFRPVTVREGDKILKMPALRAIVRSQIQLAIKGNHAAQRAVLDIVRCVEEQQEAQQSELIKAASEYKAKAAEDQALRKKNGIADGPDDPSPDDVSIDLHTGDVYFHHPDFAEEARPHRRPKKPPKRKAKSNVKEG